MDSIEQKLRQRFANKKSKQDDINVEALWGSINQGLDQDLSRKRKRFWLVIFLSFGLILAAIFWWWSLEPKGFEKNQQSMEPHLAQIIDQTLAPNCQPVQEDCEQVSPNNQLPFETQTETLALKDEFLNNTDDTPQLTKEDPITLQGDNSNATVKQDNKLISPLSTILFQVQIKEREIISSSSSDLEYTDQIPKPNNSDKGRFVLGLNGAANRSGLFFTDTENSLLENTKSDSESGDWGFNLGMDLSYFSNQQWFMQVGLEYKEQWTRFDYREINTFQVLKENVLLAVFVDSISGDTIDLVYGDTLVNATSDRQVRNFNRFRRISVPISVGFHWQKRKWQYGFSTGPTFNFLLNQEGKTLNENALVQEFGDNTTSDLLPAFNLGWHFRPFVAYSITNQLSFSLQPNLDWQRLSLFDSSTLKVNWYSFNLNIGIQYQL